MSGLRERRAGVRVKPEQAPQGATGRGLGWSRGPQVDRRRSTILEQSCGRQTGGATVGSYMCHRSRISITNCNRCQIRSLLSIGFGRYKKGFEYCQRRIYKQTVEESISLFRRLYPYRNFPQNSQNFPLNPQNFPQTHKRTLEYSKSSPIRRLERRTEDYPILETFLFFITERRFGGVGAPEGPRERVSLFVRKLSAKQKKSGFLAEYVGYYQNFPQKYQNFLQTI